MVSVIKQYFASSFYVTLIGLALAFYVGGSQGLVIAAILGVLEVSLSFDNAIVNAKIIATMTDTWKHRFITWGMVIAVFGMRLIFPVVIVAVVAHLTPWDAMILAATNHEAYAEHLETAKIVIKCFILFK